MENEARKHQQEKQQQTPKEETEEIFFFHNSASQPDFDPVKFNQVTSARHVKFNQVLREYIETSEI
jgi:hypothetical protein